MLLLGQDGSTRNRRRKCRGGSRAWSRFTNTGTAIRTGTTRTPGTLMTSTGMGITHSPLKKIINFICPGMVLLSFLFSVGAVWQLSQKAETRPSDRAVHLGGGPAVPHGQRPLGDVLQADWGFLLDPLSSVMILVITGIGFLIHVYSTGYMAHDNGYYRFFGYLNLFVFFMLMLVLANNYITAVRRLGRCRIVQLPADRVLLPQEVGGRRGQEGIHRESRGRRRIHSGHAAHDVGTRHRSKFTDVNPHSAQRTGSPSRTGGLRRPQHHVAADVLRRDWQIGAGSSVCMAAGRDGRPHRRYRR